MALINVGEGTARKLRVHISNTYPENGRGKQKKIIDGLINAFVDGKIDIDFCQSEITKEDCV